MSDVQAPRETVTAKETSSSWSAIFGALAALVSIGAGVYLLLSESASAQSTVFDALMHGIGAYFVARGLWMIGSLLHSRTSAD